MPDPTIADPGIADVALGVIGKVGYTVASILGLLYVLKWLSGIHLQALKERIETLEQIDEVSKAEIRELHKAMLEKSEAHAKVLHDLALKVITAIERQATYTKQLSRALEERACPYAPHSLSPSSEKAVSPRAPLPVPPTPGSDRIPA